MPLFALAGSPFDASLEPLIFDWTVALERPQTILAHEYWRSRAVAAIPSRADLVPGEMRKFIAHVGLVEIQAAVDPVGYRIRHAGGEWEAVFGAMGGRQLHEFLAPEFEARWRMLFDEVRQQARPVRVTTRIGFKGKSWLRTEMFVAPLSDDGSRVSMLFMCFTSWDESQTRT